MNKKISLLILITGISFNLFSQIPKFALYPQAGVGLNHMQMDLMHESNMNGSFLVGGAMDFGDKSLIQIGFYLHEHSSKQVQVTSGNTVTASLKFSNYSGHILYGRSLNANDNLDIRIYGGTSVMRPFNLSESPMNISYQDFKAVNMNLKLKLQFNFAIFNAGAEYAWGLTDVLENSDSKWNYFNVFVGLTLL